MHIISISQVVLLLLAAVAAVSSVSSAVLAYLALAISRKSDSTSSELKERLNKIDDAVVKSVMEEGGEVSLGAVMKVFHDFRKSGMLPETAIAEAKKTVFEVLKK